MADDVFEHHDRVVHDEADREGEGEQRDVVDAEAEEVHHAEGAEDGDGHRDAGDDRRGGRAEEQEDHEHDQHDGEHEGEFDVVDGVADGERFVAEDLEVDGGGQLGAEGGEQFLDAVDDFDRVGAGLALDRQGDGARGFFPGGEGGVLHAVDEPLVEPAVGFFVFDAVGDVGDVGEADGGAVAVADDDLAEALGALELAGGDEGGGLVRAVEGAGGEVDVVGVEGGADLVDADAAGGEGARIEADAHGVFLRAEDVDLRDAVNRGDALGEDGLGVFVDLGEGQGRRREREEEDGVLRRI